jgi:hypothetical protein
MVRRTDEHRQDAYLYLAGRVILEQTWVSQKPTLQAWSKPSIQTDVHSNFAEMTNTSHSLEFVAVVREPIFSMTSNVRCSQEIILIYKALSRYEHPFTNSSTSQYLLSQHRKHGRKSHPTKMQLQHLRLGSDRQRFAGSNAMRKDARHRLQTRRQEPIC